MIRMSVTKSLSLTVCFGGILALSFACSETPSTNQSGTVSKPARNSIVLDFTYGSEKDKWIQSVTDRFNHQRVKLGSGKAIYVKTHPMGSGECIDEILTESRKPHLTSPASAAFIELGNAESQTKSGRPLVGDTTELCLSPVVIGMWQPMAEALGWPEKKLGWADIHALAKSPEGWAAKGYPQWGDFRFGHTHPRYSNSGIISLFAEAYAAAGKQSNLTLSDLETPAVATYVREIEESVVHYGRSTGFFGRKMFENGPRYLSAAVLYENMIIESRDKQNLPFPIVAIYPKEGTFYSDHPVGVIDREWVTAEHREAAQLYIEFLLKAQQQEEAMQFGFRPADVSIALDQRFSKEFGVNPMQPATTLEVPSVAVAKRILGLWEENKKRSNVALVLDVSGSMQEQQKMKSAKVGAGALLSQLGDEDTFSFYSFSDEITEVSLNQQVKKNREAMQKHVRSLFANGGTALYDAIDSAFSNLQKTELNKRITAIVVLTDGTDTHSALSLSELRSRIQATNESSGGIRIFTIGYGSNAQTATLKAIAADSKGKFYKGDTSNISEIFRDISTFF